jgi:hypothetical protein
MLYLRQGRLRNLVNSPKKICDPARPNDLQGKGT